MTIAEEQTKYTESVVQAAASAWPVKAANILALTPKRSADSFRIVSEIE
jgi:hypothetical protein